MRSIDQKQESIEAKLAQLDPERQYGPRIDVKIYGTDNSQLELSGISGKGARVNAPDWLYKHLQPGIGYVVEPYPGQTEIKLDFVCHTGGEFTSYLRGADVKDENGKRIPKWVTYTGLTCNGEVVFEDEQRTWHDQAYLYKRTVQAGDTVELLIRWRGETPIRAMDRKEKSVEPKRVHGPKVSVIVPVFNPGSAIERCIESLRGQTLSDIEIIFVDDCGTDVSMNAVRAVATEDARIRIITHPENMGPGPSRNSGIEASRGEYLSFVDPDDYVSPDFLELLYTKAHTEGLDIAKGMRTKEKPDGTLLENAAALNDFILSRIDKRCPLYALFTFEHTTGLFRRELVMKSNARYGKSRASQDVTFLLRICHAAQTFGIENRATYHYVFRNSSAVNTFNPERLKEELYSLTEQLDYLLEHVKLDEHAVNYARGKIASRMNIHCYVAGIPELKESADEFLAGIREQTLRLPFIGSMKADSFSFRALVDYGASLCKQPYNRWGNQDNACHRIDIARHWCDFALAHPELADEYANDLHSILASVTNAIVRETKYGPRIDVKIYGTENSRLELRDASGMEAKVTMPAWLRKSGQPGTGYVIEPYARDRAIELDFVCKTEGEFTVALRGASVTGADGKKIPKWITYAGLTCNGEVVFEDEQKVWHDQPYIYKRPVRAGDAVNLKIRWTPVCAPIPKVSVIVPVCNPGPGFERCLESLRSQTLADIEMIFVDDCGTDGVMDMARALAADDSRIRIITNPENMGPGPSRNRGIEAARGEYLSFVDADDHVSPDFLELLYAKASAEGLDITKGMGIQEEPDGTFHKDNQTNADILNGLDEGRPLYCLFQSQHWTGLYRRALIMKSGARYGKSRNAQDVAFLLRICHAARTFGIENRATYHYVYRKASPVNTYNAQRLKNQLESLEEQIDYLVGHVAPDRDGAGYALGRLSLNLKMHAAVRDLPELKDSANEYLSGIREQALRLPYIENMKAESFVIHGLVDYGVNLSMEATTSCWTTNADNFRTRIDIAKRWFDFALAHPELANEYGAEMQQVVQLATDAVVREKKCGPRIDVKIYGTENSDLELRDASNKKAKVTMPAWLYKSHQPGTGYVIEPYARDRVIELDFVCKTEGEFRATLRVASVTGADGKKIATWVTYTGLTCNGEVVFEDEQKVRHDQPYIYKRPVRAGDAVNLKIRWTPVCAPIPKVSVIVPVCNPGPGFERCLESLRSQTLADIEMIFVDDHGTDRAMDMARAVAADDSRIRIITNPENMGPGPSRNRGIEAARGEYLSFVDADDHVSPDFLELLYAKASAEHLDIAKGTAVYEKDGRVWQRSFDWNDVILSGIKKRRPLYLLFLSEHWTGLYRRSLLMDSGARYGKARKSQDDTFLLGVCHAAQTFGIEKRAAYHYARRNSSGGNTYNAQWLKDQLESHKEQLDYLVGHVVQDEHAEKYALDKLLYRLGMHTYADGVPELEQAANAFLSGLREHALHLPYIENMKAESFVVRALVDYGVSLSVAPYAGVWEELDNARARTDIAKRWTDFSYAHPELANEYSRDLQQVLRHMSNAVDQETGYGPRIDVKIYGNEGSDIEICNIADVSARITTPRWLYNFDHIGTGYVIEPYRGQTAIVLDFVCKTAGEFTAVLRGADVKDANGKKIPKWVTYTALICNGETVFDDEQKVWHDQPYSYKKKVQTGDALKMELRWNQ